MSSDVVISVRNLGKSYLVGHNAARAERYTALRDVITRNARNLARKTRDMISGRPIVQGDEVEEFWALKDVSFEVRRGDIVGIIGRNGAGKSTLLKILSRITEPTEGRVEITGRVASLLEVGTGFHPELTGRENIYLNGAILGMTRAEIQRKFDEIVAFSEVENFLDTPVKRYSSGMYVRLAFSVAAHLEPEILVVDEVLAVGDGEFQKKCLSKMLKVAQGGRTILFVSHNMGAVTGICERGMVLNNGRIAFHGKIGQAVDFYASAAQQSGQQSISGMPQVTAVSVDRRALAAGNLKLDVKFTSPWPLHPFLIGVVVYTEYGAPIFGFNTWMDEEFSAAPVSNGVASLFVPDLPFHSGTYRVNLWLGEGVENYCIISDAAAFHFINKVSLPFGLSPEVLGPIRINGRWSLAKQNG